MNNELRAKIRAVLVEIENHRMFVVQGNIKKLVQDDLKAFLESKSVIAKSGLDATSWAERELVRLFEDAYPLSQDEIDRLVARPRKS